MALEITFDYRFDSSGFFDDAARRAALEEAGDIWGSLINDTFATVPAGISFTLDDPSSDGTTRTVTLDEPITGLTIFVGAEALGGPLAVGGYSGTSASGDVFRARVSGDFRGTGPVTNFEPWAGTISFDPTKNWSGIDQKIDDCIDQGLSPFIVLACGFTKRLPKLGNVPQQSVRVFRANIAASLRATSLVFCASRKLIAAFRPLIRDDISHVPPLSVRFATARDQDHQVAR